MKIKELLSDKSKWTKRSYARNKYNKPVLEDSPNATKFCLLGARNYCYKYNSLKRIEIEAKISLTIGLLFPRYLNKTSLIYFNDSKKTTFEMIRTVVETADV